MPESKQPISTIQKITPARAKRLLEMNTHTRRPRPGLVDQLASDMSAGHWDLNGETIKISTSGVLLDGQHRLEAVVKSGVTIESFVTEGLKEISQETVDLGAKRVASDVLALRDEVNTPVLAALAKKVMIFVRAGYKDVQLPFNKPTTLEIADAVDQYPMLREATAFALAHRRALPLGPSVLAFAYWACLMKDETDAEVFFDAVVTGANLSHGEPALTLRNKLVEKRSATRGALDEREILAYAFRAWNAYRAGRKLVLLKFGKNEAFPTPR